MKFNQRICSILAIIFAVITMCLGILHFFNYFNGNIDIMMIFLGLTMFMNGFNQINMVHEKVSNGSVKAMRIGGIFTIIVGIGIIIIVVTTAIR